jgi:hypothetical protein
MTDTPKKLVVDLAKGTQEYIDLTPAEIAERDQQAAAFAARKAEEDAAAAAAAEDKASAATKLKALGLSDSEIAALSK